ncbi:magnesium transporter [Georgenia soli]|uniref:Magnesium transporter MgtE n=1 Tax=Georgenia soli TaxID=638953 RepID=A0A2A9ELR4_9MICO|nr:magnesium transporter [Georgenia soli]PFG40027.1 magnesium transporter [Georgenia soli]
MTGVGDLDLDRTTATVERTLREQRVADLAGVLAPLTVPDVVAVLERLPGRDRAVVYRLLPKEQALEVFEALDPTLQGELVRGLQDEDVAGVFARLGPDDRVSLLDELPATVASRLLRGLVPAERELTAVVLGYPARSIGRRMSPGYVTVHPGDTVPEALARVRSRIDDAETVYTVPVVDDGRRLVGVVSLRDLMRSEPTSVRVEDLMRAPYAVPAASDAEAAARRCADLKLLALLVVDEEERLVGILTVDDALRILEEAESEDQARIGGSEPLRRPYLATPVRAVVRSRVVWLLVLGVGATLTVRVLEAFEATIAQMVVLSVFIPLLIGTGGNTGNQAATTITRALALGDVRPRDVGRVLAREARTGASLGLVLGAAGFVLASLFYGAAVGAVIGITLLAVCTLAAAVGGVMPLAARRLGADPAVFSNPFITTFVDAAGLVIYFLVARAVLGL